MNLHKLFSSSAGQGASESAIDFVPSLCSSVYGLSKTLWTIHWSANPLNPEISQKTLKTLQMPATKWDSVLLVIVKNIDAETLDGYVDQIKLLYQQYDQLNRCSERRIDWLYCWQIWGVDMFAGAVTGTVAGKGMQYANKMVPLFRNLRNANRICNFEKAMLISETERKTQSISSSLAHAAKREAYFKNVGYNFDAHNKHILGYST